jgi:hypothetical protein
MSDIAIGRGQTSQIFNPATIGLMIVVGVVGFFGALVLGAYAPALEGNGRPGGHALSNSAVGYSGLVRLASATERNPKIVRDESGWSDEDLVIATPPEAATNLSKIMAARGTTRPTLYVLPKWSVVEDPGHKGWVRVNDLLPPYEPEGVLAPGISFAIKRHAGAAPKLQYADDLPPAVAFAAPARLQVIVPWSAIGKGDKELHRPRDVAVKPPPGSKQPAAAANRTFANLTPVITDGAGGIVLGEIDNMYVLADPDLLDNAALKRPENAAAALALLDWMNSTGADSIGFDVVLVGLGQQKSLLRLAFDPPMLAMTLTLAVMVVLLGIRAAGRFGAPAPRQRAIAFGKTALVDNGAMLVRKAGKASRLGGRYAAAIREQAVRAFSVSPRLSPAEVDEYLDGLGGAVPFTRLAAAAETARGDSKMLAATKALHAWKREVVRDD